MKTEDLVPMDSSLRITGYWVVRGPEFSPSAAEQRTQVLFSKKNEPGEISSYGHHRGKPTPFGWAKRDFSVEDKESDLISSSSETLAILERCLPAYREAGAEDIVLHFIVLYVNQCNLQLSAPLLRRLAGLGIDVTLTCDTADEDDRSEGA